MGGSINRRAFITALSGAAVAPKLTGQASRPPNIIVILADDLGFGDVGCFGSTLPTPNLDRMAEEGVRLERYYSASPVCSPSRAALLTGRYPARCGVVGVLMPNATDGLKGSERTVSKILRERGYRTGCVGKWHLGTTSNCLPSSLGFDDFYGVPYSNDMSPLPIMRGTDVMDPAPAQASLTERFTSQAVNFIDRNRERPFFLYFAHTAPHIPLAPSERFRGKSGRGAYGDVVAELDWSVGEVLKALKRNGLDENTLVIFTSDNGPWYQGSAGKLRGRKGSTYEGGMRVPFIARFPGKIRAGFETTALASAMDLLPTIAGMAGASVPPSSVDGVDLWPALTGELSFIDREVLLFFDGWNIQAARWGPWKLHLARYNSFPWTEDPPGGRYNLPLNPPELYHIDDDPTESYDRAPEKPEVIKELSERVDQMLLSLPEPVRVAWQDTKNQRAINMGTGALPRRP